MNAVAAYLGVSLRRPAVWGLTLGLLAVLTISVIASYADVRQARTWLEASRTARDLSGGVCIDQGCFRPQEAEDRFPDGKTREDLPAAERVRRTEILRPIYVESLIQVVEQRERMFAPKEVAVARARSMGSVYGVAFAVLLGATLLGAEWRWRTWRTSRLQEPRLHRLLGGRLGAVWATAAIVFALAFGTMALVDLWMREHLQIGAGGGASMRAVGAAAAAALIIGVVGSTLGAVAAVVFRSSLAGFVGPAAILLVDAAASAKFPVLRNFLPVHQVGALLEVGSAVPGRTVLWWAPPLGQMECVAAGVCYQARLPPIPAARASAVLAMWAVAAIAVGLALVRARSTD